MSIAEMFTEFLGNLAIENTGVIGSRYGELTTALNKKFRDTESAEANTLRVGSFGRSTGIKGISDLDMLYIMPRTQWSIYSNDGGQLRLLGDAKEAILKRYATTDIKIDRLVVTVTYTNFRVEVQPVFEQNDGSFLYPDTKHSGSWKITKPREEMAAVKAMDAAKNGNLRRLCKMVRAWRNKHGVGMGGLLIDTLAYNFLNSTTDYDSKSYLYYDWLSRDFFKYLSELPVQNEFAAPGSRQRVRVRAKFQSKALKAYELCLEAIQAEKQANVNEKWKRVYGRPFPVSIEAVSKAVGDRAFTSWRDTEEFIEDRFSVDVRGSLRLDCEVSQQGFRTYRLRDMISKGFPLRAKKQLRFFVSDVSVPEPFELYWKVLNRGDEARRRDCIRGQIAKDLGGRQKTEPTVFRGGHLVECYCVVNGVVVARDSIDVPIIGGGSGDE